MENKGMYVVIADTSLLVARKSKQDTARLLESGEKESVNYEYYKTPGCNLYLHMDIFTFERLV